MRLFLDAHISGRRIARQLRDHGHDVRAADEELGTLAGVEGRIFVTFDVADFARIVHRWAEDGRNHSGCAIVVGIDHCEFGTIIRLILEVLAKWPDHGAWHDYTCFVTRHG